MRKSASIVAAFGLVALGYLLGSANLFAPSHLWAQDDDPDAEKAAEPISNEARDKIVAARQVLQEARDLLTSENLHIPATKGLNPIAILAGGINVKKDLEAGLGVDPGTFAALYAGLAIDEVAEKMGKDAEGRLTYNKRVIQMYPISSIKKLYQAAEVISEDDE